MKRIPLLPRKRTVVGGLLAVGMVLGAWLSGLLPGFGLGSGDQKNAVVSVSSSNHVLPPVSVDETIKAVSAESFIVDAEVLEVVVREESYLIRLTADGSERRVPADLGRIVELAQATTGNKDGIRVVILREPSARFLTWKTLEKELAGVGLAADSIELSRINLE
jgi:hypothetical protein